MAAFKKDELPRNPEEEKKLKIVEEGEKRMCHKSC